MKTTDEAYRSRAASVRASVLALSALLATVPGPTTARAADVDVSAGVLPYFAGTNVSNQLLVSHGSGAYTIDDEGEILLLLTPGALSRVDCRSPAPSPHGGRSSRR